MASAKLMLGWLRQILLDNVGDNDATEHGLDEFGVYWRVDVPVTRRDMHAMVRTLWIVRSGTEVPRFVTCWVL